MRRDLLEAVLQAQRDARPAVLVTDMDTGQQTLVTPVDGQWGQRGDVGLDEAALDAVREALAADRSGIVERDEVRRFLHVFNPPLRLIIVGAVHVAQPLAAMAALTGYAVTVVDPRSAFATGERFPGVALNGEWPDDAMAVLAPDPRTAVVTLTHDPKLDDPALAAALRSDCFYLGALGSRKTHASRLDRLAGMGFAPSALTRIRGPVGLDIGAVSPAEIAVSILAEMTQALRGGPKQGGRA